MSGSFPLFISLAKPEIGMRLAFSSFPPIGTFGMFLLLLLLLLLFVYCERIISPEGFRWEGERGTFIQMMP